LCAESATHGGSRRPAAAWARGLLLLFVALAAAAPLRAQSARAPLESEVQAAYLINFLRYTQWPERSFDSREAPYVIAVVGSEHVAARVRAVAGAAGRVDGRPVEVLWVAGARGSRAAPFDSSQDRENLLQLRRSHLVFFHASAGNIPAQALSDLWGQPVLTVSDVPGFTEAGGMIGLVRRSGSIVFEANPVAIRNSRLILSAKVLKLARITRSALR
jgi:hypothetical protein